MMISSTKGAMTLNLTRTSPNDRASLAITALQARYNSIVYSRIQNIAMDSVEM